MLRPPGRRAGPRRRGPGGFGAAGFFCPHGWRKPSAQGLIQRAAGHEQRLRRLYASARRSTNCHSRTGAGPGTRPDRRCSQAKIKGRGASCTTGGSTTGGTPSAADGIRTCTGGRRGVGNCPAFWSCGAKEVEDREADAGVRCCTDANRSCSCSCSCATSGASCANSCVSFCTSFCGKTFAQATVEAC